MSKRKTNDQIIGQMIKKANNPLVGMFVVDALSKMTEKALADTSDWTEGGTVVPVISQAVWKDAAQEIEDTLQKYYGDS